MPMSGAPCGDRLRRMQIFHLCSRAQGRGNVNRHFLSLIGESDGNLNFHIQALADGCRHRVALYLRSQHQIVTREKDRSVEGEIDRHAHRLRTGLLEHKRAEAIAYPLMSAAGAGPTVAYAGVAHWSVGLKKVISAALT
jgi:hypothetical protein